MLNHPELQKLNSDIEEHILNDERIINNKTIYQESLNILEIASELMNNVTSKNELLFMYNTLSIRLYKAGMVCKKMRNLDLGERLIVISKVIKDVLAHYLAFPKRIINKKAIIFKLWPHNCQNIKSLKEALNEYVVENAILLRCYDRLVVDFLKKFDMEIDEAIDGNDLELLLYVYAKIADIANKNAEQRFMRGLDDAWQYGVIGLVIEFMFSDFEHCFESYEYSDE